MFISLDGVDGVGKSTQVAALADWLRQQGHDVTVCRDPGSTELGDAIRALLLANDGAPICRVSEMLLYMAARAQLVEQVVRPALAAGKTVISDRYLLANVVYQGHAGGLDVDALWEIGQMVTGGLRPTITIVLDMAPAAAAGRLRRSLDRMEKQGDDFRERIRQGFLDEAAKCPGQIVVVDADRPVDVVRADVRSSVTHVLQQQTEP